MFKVGLYLQQNWTDIYKCGFYASLPLMFICGTYKFAVMKEFNFITLYSRIKILISYIMWKCMCSLWLRTGKLCTLWYFKCMNTRHLPLCNISCVHMNSELYVIVICLSSTQVKCPREQYINMYWITVREITSLLHIIHCINFIRIIIGANQSGRLPSPCWT
jgi:hypothetical protein